MTMQKAPTITCVISSHSEEALRAAELLATEKVALDNVFTDVVRRFPRGIEKRRLEKHTLGDYFDGIQVLKVASVKMRTIDFG